MSWSLPNSSPTLDSKHFEIVLFRILIWENTPGFHDGWMDLVSSQGSTLLLAELSGLDVTDTGFIFIKDCKNLEASNLNYREQISYRIFIKDFKNLEASNLNYRELISDRGLEAISGICYSVPFYVCLTKSDPRPKVDVMARWYQ